MDSVEKVLKAVMDFHAGDPQLLAVQLKASPASVQRWVTGAAKPRPAYEAKLRKIYSELASQPSELRETSPAYRVTPHHPMITEAVDATLRSIREILHKRAHLSSRSQALDELSKLLFCSRRRFAPWQQGHFPTDRCAKRPQSGRSFERACGRNDAAQLTGITRAFRRCAGF